MGVHTLSTPLVVLVFSSAPAVVWKRPGPVRPPVVASRGVALCGTTMGTTIYGHNKKSGDTLGIPGLPPLGSQVGCIAHIDTLTVPANVDIMCRHGLSFLWRSQRHSESVHRPVALPWQERDRPLSFRA